MLKKIFGVMVIACFSFQAFSTTVVDEIEETLQKFDACSGEGYSEISSDLDQFKALFATLKSDAESTVQVTDFSFDNITLKDFKSGDECTLYVDVYDGRCVYALCN